MRGVAGKRRYTVASVALASTDSARQKAWAEGRKRLAALIRWYGGLYQDGDEGRSRGPKAPAKSQGEMPEMGDGRAGPARMGAPRSVANNTCGGAADDLGDRPVHSDRWERR